MEALGGSIGTGSVTYAGSVSITSDIPIVGFTTIKQEYNGQGDIFNLVNISNATAKMGFVPHAVRSANGTASTDWSRINIANLGQVNASVVISFYNASGTLQGVLTPAIDIGASKVIAPGAVASINMKSGGDLATTTLLDSKAGSGFNGSMVIAADQPIAVLVDGISSSDGNTSQTSSNVLSFDSYNGFTR
jgi:hypothetical protein